MSLSSRCTMPGRSISPYPSSGRRASSGYIASRPETSVPDRWARIGMNHDAGWLVDDDHRLVVVDDPKRDLSRLSRRRHGAVATDDEPRGRSRGSRRLGPAGCRRRRPRRRGATPPAAMSFATWARVRPDSRATTLSTRSPPSAPGSRRPVAGPPSSLMRRHARPGSGGCLVAEDRQRTMQSRMLPQTIDESATLNVGQKPE